MRTAHVIRDEEGLATRDLWTGIGFWTLFAFLAVALRGVRWEENYERAQLILGTVRYPVEHPFYQYTFRVMPVQYLLTCALMLLVSSPLLVCGLWNVFFLLGAVLPMFLLTGLVTRRAIWGHVAGLLMLLDVQVAFAPYYPLGAWPALFSLGQMGIACALLALFLLLRGQWRAGGFLVGLMPLIHIGHAPVPFMMACLVGVQLWRRGSTRQATAGLRWCLLGVSVSAAFWIVKSMVFDAPPVTEGPYFSPEDWHEVWQRYTFHHDVHRGFPRFSSLGNTLFMVTGTLLMGVGAVRWDALRGRSTGVYYGLFVWLLCAVGLAAGCALVNVVLGSETPFWVIGWMPYRMLNYAVLVHIVMTVGILANGRVFGARRSDPPVGIALMAAVLAYALARPVLAWLLPEALYARYFGLPEALLFVLGGGAFGLLFSDLKHDRPFAAWWIGACAAALGALALYHQFGAFCMACGFAAALGIVALAYRRPAFGPILANAKALTVLWALVLLSVTYHEWRAREHLPGDSFDRQVTAYLADRGEPDAMILGPHSQIRGQERMGHPFLVTFETCHLLSYVPSLAPTLEKMYGELFDIRFGEPWGYDLNAWVARPRVRWRELAATYAFRYVLCPNEYVLDLPPALRGDRYALYEIPQGP